MNWPRVKLLPGTEEMWRFSETLRNHHECYKVKGVPVHGRDHGLYKISSELKGLALGAGYTLVREGTYYAYVQAPEASKS